MYGTLGAELAAESAALSLDVLVLDSPQSARITAGGRPLLNFSSNNYLGLADDPRVIAAAQRGLVERGFGMASVRFISGTQDLHLALEARVSEHLGTAGTVLFPSCFDANAGIFEVLLGADDVVISDQLNHASIIDGIRLSKARRLRYRNTDLDDLEIQLRSARGARRVLVVTDGVFSMDGSLAPLPGICDLADRYGALVMVDDSHGTGVLGGGGRGTPEHFGVSDRIDVLTGTFGKALGGASGGYVSTHQEIAALVRRRARPYVFSNALPPMVTSGNLCALEVAASADAPRARLAANTSTFRKLMSGFDLLPGDHPIVAVRTDDAVGIAKRMRAAGVHVAPITFPVVPRGTDRIRVQLSAAHTAQDIHVAVSAFRRAQ